VGSYGSVSAADAAHCAVDVGAPIIKVADQGAGESDKVIPPARANGDGVLAPPNDLDKVPVLKHIVATGPAFWSLARRMGCGASPRGMAINSWCCRFLRMERRSCLALNSIFCINAFDDRRRANYGAWRRTWVEGAVSSQRARVSGSLRNSGRSGTSAGIMWDSSGKNLTHDQVSRIAGVAPTAVIGQDPSGANAMAPTRSALEAVQSTAFGRVGDPDAPRLWVFVDPLCSYSVRALQSLKPFVDQHRVQVAIIPISVLDHEDQNQSTPAALALLSKASDQMVSAWEHQDYGATGGPEVSARLRTNMEAAQAIGLRGTPTLVWRKPDGSEGRIDGMPNDWQSLMASVGESIHAIDER
jgi:thiol:disulfide interchange protein DsbG